MKKLFVLLVFVLIFSMFVYADEDGIEDSKKAQIAEKIEKGIEDNLEKLPPMAKFMLGKSTVNVEIRMNEGDKEVLGFRIEKGEVKEFTEEALDDPSFIIKTDENTLTKVYEAKNKKETALKAYKFERIQIIPMKIGAKLKWFLAEFFYNLFGEEDEVELNQTTAEDLGVEFYEGFDEDLKRILERKDNNIRKVLPESRDELHDKMNNYAKGLGLNIDNVKSKGGNLFGANYDEDQLPEITFIYFDPSEDEDDNMDELLSARKSFSHMKGSVEEMSKDKIYELGDKALTESGLTTETEFDRIKQAEPITLKQVDDDVSWFVMHSAGYYRVIESSEGERQVINSMTRVDIDVAEEKAAGITLRNWVGVSDQVENVELKTFDKLKQDIIDTMAYESGGTHNIEVTKCYETYFQQYGDLVPTITCYGGLIKDGEKVAYSPVVATMSLSPRYTVNEGEIGESVVELIEKEQSGSGDSGEGFDFDKGRNIGGDGEGFEGRDIRLLGCYDPDAIDLYGGSGWKYIKSTVVYEGQEYEDYCDEGGERPMTEYFCQNEENNLVIYGQDLFEGGVDCECVDGRCIPEEGLTGCYDPDSQGDQDQAFIKAVTIIQGFEYEDSCYDDESLIEYSCYGDGLLDILHLDCECVDDGRCELGTYEPEEEVEEEEVEYVEGCYDPDVNYNPDYGYYIQSTVLFEDQVYEDSCNIYESLTEYICVDEEGYYPVDIGSEWSIVSKSCEEGCVNGRCIPEEGLTGCYDPDSQGTSDQAFIKAVTTIQGFEYEDSCYNDESLIEYSCSDGGLLDILHLDCECVDGGRCEEGSYEPEFVDPYESQGEVAGSKFAAYYDNGEDRFYDGAKKFRDEFNDYWSYYYFRPAYENYFEEDSFDHADAVDLILFFGHGGTGTIATTDSSVTLYGSYGNLLGLKDLEYFATKSCLTATVAYCSDMYGHERYTAQEVNYNELTGSYTMDWISIFSGLHVYSGMNGLAYSSSDSSEDLSNKYANYLMTVGLPVVDAWQYAALDSNDWYLYTYNGCTMFDDPENSCSYEEFDCNRWEMYPATFYIDEKRSESLFMAAIPSIEEDDPVPGDPDYDIDFVYTYQSSTVPAFSLGYPLP